MSIKTAIGLGRIRFFGFTRTELFRIARTFYGYLNDRRQTGSRIKIRRASDENLKLKRTDQLTMTDESETNEKMSFMAHVCRRWSTARAGDPRQ